MNVDKSSIVITRAKPEDAEVICDIRDRAWMGAYPNAQLGITEDDIRLNAQGRHGEFVPRRIAYLTEKLSRDDRTDITVYVAKVSGKVLGYAEPSIDEHGRRWINAMYVAPEAQGKGIGGALMRRLLEVLGRDEDIYLEVVRYNNKAIGFYEHFGFQKTDTVVPEEEGRPAYMKTLPQVEMVLRRSS